MEIEADYATISSNDEDAILYINDKSTKKSIYEMNKIGPLKLDGSVKVQAKIKEGAIEYKTDIVKVDREEITLDFKHITAENAAIEKKQSLIQLADENYDAIETFYHDYRAAYVEDYNNHEFNYTRQYVAENSKPAKELLSFFENPKNVKYESSITTGNNTMSDLVAVNDTTFRFTSRAIYSSSDNLGATHDYDVTKVYTVVTSGDSYLITATQ
ncbi:MAG: hypothetical protein KBT36_10620 [Kurthia sp.]|nr:hypothetical protein [Candidatus Kurthia equi]